MIKGFVLLALVVGFARGAQADVITYTATLSGLNENPPNASPATGFVDVTYDDSLHELTYDVVFAGLLGTTTAAHIHCCNSAPANSPVATQTPSLPGFPLGVTSGTYFATFDLLQSSSWNPAFITAHGGTAAGAEAAFVAALDAGNMAYFNIHTNVFPGGEIRGFLQPSQVPEPASLLLVGLGLAGACVRRSRRRRAIK